MDGKIVKILITCKTYPNPSLSYQEIVCTAGITEQGQFVRLYPVNYRYLPADKQYKKYDWIATGLEKRMEDPRPESYRPDIRNLQIIDRIGTEHNWENRKKIVLSAPQQTMCDLQSQGQAVQSLGIVKPRKIIGLTTKLTERDWSAAHQNLLRQENLFGDKNKPLEKIPFAFYVKYFCEHPDCKSHDQSIIDWELSSLYLKMKKQYASEDKAIAMVHQKYLDEILSDKCDTLFFVGTVLKHNSWLVIGMFYPKKERQMGLFG